MAGGIKVHDQTTSMNESNKLQISNVVPVFTEETGLSHTMPFLRASLPGVFYPLQLSSPAKDSEKMFPQSREGWTSASDNAQPMELKIFNPQPSCRVFMGKTLKNSLNL